MDITTRSLNARSGWGYTVNDAAFDVPSLEAAYWLGFLLADGCVTGCNVVEITVCERDAAHIEKLRRFLDSNHRITQDRACVRLRFSSPHMLGTLERHGVIRAKSLVAQPSQEWLGSRDYWRGYVDGNGHIKLTWEKQPKYSRQPHAFVPRISVCGAISVMKALAMFIAANVPGMAPTVLPAGRVGQIRVGGRRAVTVARLLYGESCSVALDRKREEALSIIEFGEDKWGMAA